MRKLVVLAAALMLTAFYLALSLHPSRPSPFLSGAGATHLGLEQTPGAQLLFSFEDGRCDLAVQNGSASVVSDEHTDGGRSACFAARFTGDVGGDKDLTVTLPASVDWGHVGTIHADVMARGRELGAGKVQALFFIKTIENRWYQRDFEGYLPKGRWVTLSADLSGTSTDWLPVSHRSAWDGDSHQFIDTFSIRFYDKQSARAEVLLDSLRCLPPPSTGTVSAARVANLYAESGSVPVYGKFELSFRINRTYANPFDPDEVDVQGMFVSPSGRVVNVPAFFYQAFERSMANGLEALSAYGPKYWKIRFCPTEAGVYRYRIRVHDDAETLSPEYSFQATPSEAKGFVRVSKQDSRFFEYDNGEFFYPIGMNAVSPWDSGYNVDYVRPLPRGKGTYAFDDYLEKMGANGGNWIRMWMAEWWLAIEWSRGSGPFLGLGRYSLENAWRLDHILEEAERRGVYIDLTLINHLQFNTSYHWNVNPYNQNYRAAPGPCRDVNDFYSNEEARRYFKKRLRYIVARWGYSPHIFAWDLWSEAEFAPTWMSRMPHGGALWHQEMFDALKQLDPWGHLTATHFNNPDASVETWRLPQMAFVHATLWPSNWGTPKRIDEALVLYDNVCRQYGKPYFGGEFGGHWGGSSPQVMERDLHTGLWRTLTLNAGGTPMFWWWNFLHNRDLYFEFHSLSRFLDGEDFRGAGRRDRVERATAEAFTPEAYSFGDERWRIVWVVDPLAVWRVPDELRDCRNAAVTLSQMQSGKYQIEVWDTLLGERLTATEATAADGSLTFGLPPFRRDVACKVKKAE